MSDYVHEVTDDENEKIARFLRYLAVGTVLFVVLIVVLFATADRWLRLISHESERRFVEPYIEWTRENLPLNADPVLQAYVESISNDIYSRLEPGDGQVLTVQVIKGDTLNAFATLGGYVFVFEGLIRAVGNENSLAMVLGHEIAHVHHRDPLLSTGRGMLVALAISTLSGGGFNPQDVDAGTDILLNQYSREQESDADELAFSLLAARYGHVGGATRLFEIIAAESDAVEIAEFLSSHPDIDARIERIEALAAEKGWGAGDPTPYPPDVQAILSR